MSFLVLDNLTKRYGEFVAADSVSLSIEKGEFVSLLGPSGCGKTTTLMMIAGFIDATAGRITLDGQDLTHVKPNRRGLGMVFQSYALFPHMTVADNVAFGLEMRKVPKADRGKRVARALELVHLEKHAGRFPRELSGGQRQRVALARALVIEPPVLLLDEPMSNLDAKLREEMQFELRAIQREVGTTTIMVTHDQSEALSISDRVVVMEAGRVTQVDVPYRAYEHPETSFVSRFIGKANLLPATVSSVGNDSIELDVAGRRLAIGRNASAVQAGDGVTLCIRPEKMRLCAPSDGHLPARVSSRFFLGSQWLYRVDSAFGELLVCTQNEGNEPVAEGADVGLSWHGDAVRMVDRGVCHG
ncbi:Fe3+/spermidine/putrescine ABC transporter ATP-binding protein [Pandoraea terrae]|uniref:Spermidine/putrescine import ATP-binding protein PotA n=1 Tax=Pandoraea terrae TaxID=1537710 RepID=A0A5E4YI91_9BURK|nr:ABC transporter ATP-binding protein [Pandoraea terrae]VVE48247.1 Fe3+/spermidine/putrescine ABC transporter ATP-binding protein [Pandoraea terrae]